MLAVIKTGGKQYIVEKGQTLAIEKIAGKEGAQVTLPDVLLVADDKKTEIGTPTLEKAKVNATIIEQGKADKVEILKFKAKTGYRRKTGHRQPMTKIKIDDIRA